jgi:hypothetical protein
VSNQSKKINTIIIWSTTINLALSHFKNHQTIGISKKSFADKKIKNIKFQFVFKKISQKYIYQKIKISRLSIMNMIINRLGLGL